jgi:hypothetical protein
MQWCCFEVSEAGMHLGACHAHSLRLGSGVVGPEGQCRARAYQGMQGGVLHLSGDAVLEGQCVANVYQGTLCTACIGGALLLCSRSSAKVRDLGQELFGLVVLLFRSKGQE